MPFSMEVIGYNAKTKEAGKVKEYNNAVLCTNKVKRISPKTTHKRLNSKKHSQNHFINSTRNIELPNGDRKRLHIWLIRQFNGEKVVWNIHG